VRVNWSEIIPMAVEQAQAYMSDFSAAPTLRAIYYRLVSIEAIPNTKSAYQGLSRALTKARKEGLFPWHLMDDLTRDIINKQKPSTLNSVLHWAKTEKRDHMRKLLAKFRNIKDPRVDFKPHRWDGQDNKVAIALEKEAVGKAVQNVVADLGIEIFPMKGYSSTTFMKEIADRLDDMTGKINLLIISDYDPSGEDIARHTEEQLRYEYGVDVECVKILLNKDQILEYDLPATPEDAAEIAKMARDPRFTGWADGFYRVELDAMAAIVPQEFRRVIREAIAEYFDEDIYEENMTVAREACDQAEEDLRDLFEKIEGAYDLLLELVDEE